MNFLQIFENSPAEKIILKTQGLTAKLKIQWQHEAVKNCEVIGTKGITDS